jgi:hypothetical protein
MKPQGKTPAMFFAILLAWTRSRPGRPWLDSMKAPVKAF